MSVQSHSAKKQKMKEYYSQFSNYNINNLYIHIDYVQDVDTLYRFNNLSQFTNINVDLDIFFAKYVEFENKRDSVRSDCSIKYGVVISIMLDCVRSDDDIQLLLDKLNDDVNLSYVAYTNFEGDAYMLYIYVCEREYDFVAGITQTYVANNDIYVDFKTKKRCKKDDKNAVVLHKKGEIIRQKIEPFGPKNRIFHCKSKNSFNSLIKKIKKRYIDICEELFDNAVNEGVVFKKINYKNKPDVQKYNAIYLNQQIKKLEDHLDYQIKRVVMCEEYTEKFEIELNNIIRKYNSKFKKLDTFGEEQFKLKNSRKSCKLRLNDYKNFKDTALDITTKIKKEVDDLVNNYI